MRYFDRETLQMPRMTTRRWMIAVMLIAFLTASCIHAVRWHRYRAALHKHLAYKKFYEEGRVTALKYLEKSQDLMDAQILTCPSRESSAAVVSAHLERSEDVLKQEEAYLLRCGCRSGVADFLEVQDYLDRFKARMIAATKTR